MGAERRDGRGEEGKGGKGRGVEGRAVADTEGAAPPEAHTPTLPLQKSVESKAGKTQFEKYMFLVFLYLKKTTIRQNIAFKGFLKKHLQFLCVKCLN